MYDAPQLLSIEFQFILFHVFHDHTVYYFKSETNHVPQLLY